MQLFCSWQQKKRVYNIITLVWTLVKCQELKDKWNCFGCKTTLQNTKFSTFGIWSENDTQIERILCSIYICTNLTHKLKPYGKLHPKK